MAYKNKGLILATVSISTLMATIDGSAVNIALPTITRELHATISASQWIVTSYLLTISTLLLLWGRLSDIYGKKFLFAIGLAIFTIGSFICGTATTLPLLIGARVLQALGASITMALNQGIITTVYPPQERGKALGMIGTIVAVGSLIGPSLGGFLVKSFGWKSIFLINLPFGVVGVILALILIPNLKSNEVPVKFDKLGAGLFMSAMLFMFIGLLSLQDHLLTQPVALLMIVLAILLLFVMIVVEKKRTNAFLEVKMFKNKDFSVGLLSAYISYVSMFAYVFFMPFYLQLILKLEVQQAGLLMGLFPLTTAVVAPFSGWLSDKISYKPLTFFGMIMSTIAFTLLSQATQQTPLVYVGFLIVLLGIGGGTFQSPNTSSVMGAVTREQLGMAGSINAFFRNFGMVSGTTFAILVFMAVAHVSIESVSNNPAEMMVFLKGFKVVLLCGAGLSLIGVGLNGRRLQLKKGAQ